MLDKILWTLVGLTLAYALASWYITAQFNLDCNRAGGQAVRTLSFETICIPEGVLIE